MDGIFFRTRAGCPWRDLPERSGNWKTVYNRHRRWSADGAAARRPASGRSGSSGQEVGRMAARKIEHSSVESTDRQNDLDRYVEFANRLSVDDRDDEYSDYGADDFDDEEDLDQDIDDEDRNEEEGL
jgi:Putative transposase of IS4/5 family (DUF4096)